MASYFFLCLLRYLPDPTFSRCTRTHTIKLERIVEGLNGDRICRRIATIRQHFKKQVSTAAASVAVKPSVQATTK